MKPIGTLAASAAFALVLALPAPAADPAPATNRPAPKVEELFPDQVIARGKGVEVTRSQLENAYIVLKSNVAAQGGKIPEAQRKDFEARLLTDLIVSQVLMGRASDADKIIGREKGEKLIKETRDRALSEEVLRAQLKAVGMSYEDFKKNVVEKAICREVMERDLRPQIKITEADVQKFYADNPARFEQPEMVRVAHIMLLTKDPNTGTELTDKQKDEKQQSLKQLREKVLKGEDFAALAKQHSEDLLSKERGGELTFPKGRMSMPFEMAAFSLSPNQVSDVVTTPNGYHLIKLIEKIPAKKVPLAEVKENVQKFLEQQELDKLMPDYFEKAKKSAAVEILDPSLRAVPAAPAAK